MTEREMPPLTRKNFANALGPVRNNENNADDEIINSSGLEGLRNYGDECQSLLWSGEERSTATASATRELRAEFNRKIDFLKDILLKKDE